MKDISQSNFGLLIAYALPGFVAIWGISGIWPAAAVCLGEAGACPIVPSLVGFLNTTVAAIAAGMAVSAIRFVVVDTIHTLTGLVRPKWDDAALQENLAAVDSVIEHHYRYYQFHANMLIAGIIGYGVHLYDHRDFSGVLAAIVCVLATVFWITARDNLRKYYHSLDTIFNPPKAEGLPMSNGRHHPEKEPDDKNKPTRSSTRATPKKEKPAPVKPAKTQ